MGATPQVAIKSKSPRTLEEEEGHGNEKVVRKSRRVKAIMPLSMECFDRRRLVDNRHD